MTFAVGAFLPFPFFPEIPRRGIVLAADTRYSFRDTSGRQTRTPFDFGMKLAQLGPAAGCACAGDALSAQNAMAELTSFFGTTDRPKSGNFPTQELSARLTVADERSRQDGVLKDYALIIGCLNDRDAPELICVGPTDQVQNQPSSWGLVIGQRQHQAEFETALKQQVDRIIHSSSFSFEPDQWILPFVMALQTSFLDRPVNETIGGGLQVATITPDDGYGQRDIYFGSTGGDDIEWQRGTRDVTFDWLQVPHDAGFAIEARSLTI
jgi:hypothetical protein